MAVKVYVRKDHIEEDRDERLMAGDKCMVHDPICDTLQLEKRHGTGKKAIQVFTGYESTEIRYGNKSIEVTHPSTVERRISRWDDGLTIKPFEFDFDLPEDWRERLGLDA